MSDSDHKPPKEPGYAPTRQWEGCAEEPEKRHDETPENDPPDESRPSEPCDAERAEAAAAERTHEKSPAATRRIPSSQLVFAEDDVSPFFVLFYIIVLWNLCETLGAGLFLFATGILLLLKKPDGGLRVRGYLIAAFLGAAVMYCFLESIITSSWGHQVLTNRLHDAVTPEELARLFKRKVSPELQTAVAYLIVQVILGMGAAYFFLIHTLPRLLLPRIMKEQPTFVTPWHVSLLYAITFTGVAFMIPVFF